MSGIGGDISNDPFSPKQTTTQIFPIPIQTSTSAFVFPITPTTPTPSIPPLTFSTEATEVITKTKLDPSLPAISTVSHRGTNTLTLAVPKGQGSNNNNNNTISTAAIIFSIMIGFVIVGGCITLIFTRKRHPENKKKRTEIIQRNLYGEEPCELNESNDNDRIVVRPINSISPPLNLPPPPPQRSPHPPSSPRDSLPLPPIPQFPPPLQHLPSSSPSPSPPPTPEHPPPQPLPSIPQHSPIVLYRNPSLKRNGSKNNYDYNISEDYYQRYSQFRPPSASASASSASYNNVEDRPTSEPP